MKKEIVYSENKVVQADRIMSESTADRRWWVVVVLLIMCLYWLSNVVLWIPWSHNPQLGMVLMLTVNPVFWGIGIYRCLACKGGAENLMKKAFIVSLIAVGISLISDYLFFAVLMKSKDVWHITTFYGYAWLVVLAVSEASLLKKRLSSLSFVPTAKTLLVLVSCLLLLLSFILYLI